ncbi:DUF4184 family protein [Methanolobus sp. ZRKC3]|uniref:DUF4184 family protein n=1 Tax=Methanolobus sp. ZRKC3 TaxID=3125786 RepID=UPI003243531E
MPFTPFHLGPALFFSGLGGKRVNLAAIVLGSIIIDVRAAYCIFAGCRPLHGPMHTFAAAAIIALLISAALYSQRGILQRITDTLGLKQNYSILTIVSSSLIGTWSHVLLDSFLYNDIVPLCPLNSNPFLGLVGAGTMYSACLLAFFIGIGIYLYMYLKK